jgi:nucleoside-diphosphate-sugar epimerase
MKIAVTGHTSGIGLAFYNKFIQLGHNVLGFSRSNGHDISLISASKFAEYDLFVNNAYHPTGQNKILEELLKLWEGTDKCIINISSNIVNLQTQLPPNVAEYRKTKQLANDLINNYNGSINILNVLPDLVNTNFYLGGKELEQGMDPAYIVNIVLDKLNHPGVNELIITHPAWS